MRRLLPLVLLLAACSQAEPPLVPVALDRPSKIQPPIALAVATHQDVADPHVWQVTVRVGASVPLTDVGLRAVAETGLAITTAPPAEQHDLIAGAQCDYRFTVHLTAATGQVRIIAAGQSGAQEISRVVILDVPPLPAAPPRITPVVDPAAPAPSTSTAPSPAAPLGTVDSGERLHLQPATTR